MYVVARSNYYRVGIVVLIFLLLITGALVWGYFALEDEVGDQIQARAQEAGLEVSWGVLDAKPWGVSLADVVVKRNDVTIARFDQIRVDARWFDTETLSGAPPVEEIIIDGGIISPVSFGAAAGAAMVDEAPERDRQLSRIAQLFGGEPPDLEFRNIRIETEHLGLPVLGATLSELETDFEGDKWTATGKLEFEKREDSSIDVGSGATLQAEMVETDAGWQPLPLLVTFDTPLGVDAGSVKASVGAVSLDGLERVTLRDVELAQGLFASAKAEMVELAPTTALVEGSLTAIQDLRVDGAVVRVTGDLLHDDHSSGAEVAGPSMNWNTLLTTVWERAFAAADEATQKLAAAAPELVIITNSALEWDGGRIAAIDAVWFGGEEERFSVSGVARVGKKNLGRFEVRYEREETQPRVIARLERLDAGFVAKELHDRGWTPWRAPVKGRIDLELELTQDPTDIHPFAGSVTLRDFVVNDPRLSRDPVRVTHAAYRFEGRHAPRAGVAEPSVIGHPTGYADIPTAWSRGSIEIDRGILEVGEVSAELTFEVYGLSALPEHLPARADMHFDLPPTDVRDVRDAVPRAILGDLADAQIRGELSWLLEVEVPLQNASATRWRSTPKLDHFRLVNLPKSVDVTRLLRATDLTLSDPEIGFERTIQIPEMRSERDPRAAGPRPPWRHNGRKNGERCGPYVYTPLDYISPYMRAGVLTTEDGSFYSHEGFNVGAIRNAIERNLAAGRFVLGASTISMQLVKNVFLHGEKTIARKIQEGLLVWLMESVVRVPKTRLLEIYFNVIEYGPGIYGIHEAALYYFGKRPNELSVNEVAFFLSSLPSPKASHDYFANGRISDARWERMKRYIDAMYRRGRIDEYELLTAKAERPRFRPVSDACAPGYGLNDPERYADAVEERRAWMHRLRVLQDVSRSELLRLSEATEPVLKP